MSCESGKRPYRTQDLAKRVALAVSRRSHRPLRAYACEICRAWHVTSDRRRQRGLPA